MGDAARGRSLWNAKADAYQAGYGQATKRAPAAWGTLRFPEDDLDVLGPVAGRDVLDLGCGSGHWAHALAQQAARAVGLDVSERQLHHARLTLGTSRAEATFLQASGDCLPFRAGAFDIVLSDGGAMTWCDPRLALPEVVRVLRPDGLIAFCATAAFAVSHWGPDDGLPGPRLQAPYFGAARHYPDGAVRYALPHGDWIDLFRANGLAVERLVELRPTTQLASPYPELIEWMRSWPFEEIWVARKIGSNLG